MLRTQTKLQALKAMLSALSLAVILTGFTATTQAEKEDGKKGKLAEIKQRVVDVEVKHRKNLNEIHEQLEDARKAKDTERITKLNADIKKERERFRDEIQKVQRLLKDKVVAKGLGDLLAEKKKARAEVEATVKKLRAEINKARNAGDKEKVAELEKRMKNVEKTFIEKLEKLLDRLAAKDDIDN